MGDSKIPKEFEGKTIYSISRLDKFEECPYSFYLIYKQKVKGKPNIFSLLGSTIHNILESLQFEKISKEDALVKFYNAVFEYTNILDYKFTSDKVANNLIGSISHYITNYKPIKCKKFESEYQFYTTINDIVLTGFIDGIIVLDNDTVHIIDYKTSTKFNKTELIKKGRQLVLYAYALEKERDIKVSSVAWNMLKYVIVTWKGATKPRSMMMLRTEIVKALRSELKKQLRKLNYSDIEIELILDEAEKKNDLNLLPHDLAKQFNINDAIIEYTYNEDTKQELINFVTNTVSDIESRSNIEDEWECRDIDKENYYCSVLCDVSTHCKHYKSWVERNADSFNEKSNNDEDLIKELFG